VQRATVLTTEVLLAGGRLVTANPREHADLFWAIRGGGGNFGIVTTFEHELFRLDFVLSGLLYFPVSRTTDVRLPQFDRRAPDELQTRGGLMGTRHRPRADRVTLLLRCSRRWRWRTWLRPVKDTVQAGLYTAEFSIGDGPSSGGGAFLPELSDVVSEVLASSYSNAPRDASAMWNDFHGVVTRVQIEAAAFPLRRRGVMCQNWIDDASDVDWRSDSVASLCRGALRMA
jgi:hypothetical protein